jgi:predicted Rossmann fold nucleotide-binding protein DprA/Smf involved in DNA uptake
MIKDAAYWIALAHMPRWGYLKINNLIIKFYHENQISIEEFFNLSENDLKNNYALETKEISDILKAKSELANNAFLAESLYSQGYELIPIISSDYSKTLKSNLKAAHAPALLYIKGNKKIMQEKSLAVVGSRDASEISLKFTDNIAKLASKEYKVVVSGFAKGVDKQALDSAINYKGQSIIVLPQGIMTFNSGFKTYYKQIVDGDVLVLSTFFPKVPWKAELAMARNPIIYGLADEIYVAESSEKGGTWSGVIDGLRKGRVIYIRNPQLNEKNANNILISNGAVPVDFEGLKIEKQYSDINVEQTNIVSEPENQTEVRIITLLKHGEYSAKEIKDRLQLKWTEHQLRNYLKTQKEVESIKKKTLKYRLKQLANIQGTLF